MICEINSSVINVNKYNKPRTVVTVLSFGTESPPISSDWQLLVTESRPVPAVLQGSLSESHTNHDMKLVTVRASP
jgi:hypothetical protein